MSSYITASYWMAVDTIWCSSAPPVWSTRRSRVRRRLIAALSGLVAAMFTLSACTGEGIQPSTPSLAAVWAAQFSQALADPDLSDFAHQVLSDYAITPAEYQESFGRFSQCLVNVGYTVSGDPQGYTVTPPDTGPIANQTQAVKDQMGVINTCQDPDSDSGWITISSIYEGMENDPQGLTSEQLIRQCFQAHRVPDGAGMSDDQFAQMIDDPAYEPSTPDATLCFWDPTGAMGYTVEMAEQFQANLRLGATYTSQPTNTTTGK